MTGDSGGSRRATGGGGRGAWWPWSDLTLFVGVFSVVQIVIRAIMQDWANVVAYALLLAVALVWLWVRSRRRLRRAARDD